MMALKKHHTASRAEIVANLFHFRRMSRNSYKSATPRRPVLIFKIVKTFFPCILYEKTSKTGLQRPACRYDGIGKIGGGWGGWSGWGG